MGHHHVFLMGDASYESELINTGGQPVFNLYIHSQMKLPLKKINCKCTYDNCKRYGRVQTILVSNDFNFLYINSCELHTALHTLT
jgi:hypothetical protein